MQKLSEDIHVASSDQEIFGRMNRNKNTYEFEKRCQRLAKGQAMGLVISSLKGPEKPQPFPKNSLQLIWPQRKLGVQKETQLIIEKAKNPKGDMWLNTVRVDEKILSLDPHKIVDLSPNISSFTNRNSFTN